MKKKTEDGVYFRTGDSEINKKFSISLAINGEKLKEVLTKFMLSYSRKTKNPKL